MSEFELSKRVRDINYKDFEVVFCFFVFRKGRRYWCRVRRRVIRGKLDKLVGEKF